MTILKLLAWTGVSVVLAAGQPESGRGTGENICGTNRTRRGVREGAWFLGVHATALEPACAHRWEPAPGWRS
jgi:hypothetical protein